MEFDLNRIEFAFQIITAISMIINCILVAIIIINKNTANIDKIISCIKAVLFITIVSGILGTILP